MEGVIGYNNVKLPKDRRTRGVLYLRNLPKSVKLLFKSHVARRGQTMEEVILELIKKYNEDPSCIDRWAKKRAKKEKKK